MMSEKDKNAVLNYFKQMIANWSYLNTSPTKHSLTLNCLDPECEKIIVETYKDYVRLESPIYYYFLIGGNYINLQKNDPVSS